ncbi:MAG: hypothetical protein CSA20_07445 [Deltaproteobacteria bacterium]|nr:MAG: hypothetical protein CSA20_07445 [Deltaproteobacteria bacterium]
MQCERLIKQIKSWYLHVKNETMAPARMVSFMEKHAKTCEVCLADPDLREEIVKITDLVLPESKIPKAVRQINSKEEENVDENGSTDDDILDEDEDAIADTDEVDVDDVD